MSLEITNGHDGIRISPGERFVEFGLVWDGAERMVVKVYAEDLLSIVQQSVDWHPEPRVVQVSTCKHVECNLERSE